MTQALSFNWTGTDQFALAVDHQGVKIEAIGVIDRANQTAILEFTDPWTDKDHQIKYQQVGSGRAIQKHANSLAHNVRELIVGGPVGN